MALDSALLPDADQGRKVYVLHGLGGIGKTQLAVKFARDHQKDFSASIFLDASSEDSLIKGFALMFRRITESGKESQLPDSRDASAELTVDYIINEVKRWLSLEGNSRWLLIIDNLDREATDEGGFDILPFLPAKDHGSVLVTTRLAPLARLGKGKKVERMSSQESFDLLHGLLTGDTNRGSSPGSAGNKGKKELLASLDGLPLAIAQAGRFIQTFNLSIDRYLDLYSTSRKEVIDMLSPEHGCQDSIKGSIRTTWMVSLNILRGKSTKSNTHFAAYRLLQLFYFDPCDIQYKILRRGLIGHDIPAWFKTTLGSRLKFLAVIKILLDLSLVDHVSEGAYSMHRVVHDWLCTYVCPNTDAELVRLAAAAVSFSGPTVRNLASVDDRLLRQQLAIHASFVIPRLRGCDPSDLLVRYDLMPDAELEEVASLRGEPARCWSLLRFGSSIGGLFYTLSIQQRKDMAPVIDELLSRCPRHLGGNDTGGLNPTYVLLEYERCTMRIDGPEPERLRRIADDFLAIGSKLWAACALNSLALRTNKLAEALRLWESALAMSYSVTGTLFLYPTQMIFCNLYSRLPRGVQRRELLGLYQNDLIDGWDERVSKIDSMFAELGRLRKAIAPSKAIGAGSQFEGNPWT